MKGSNEEVVGKCRVCGGQVIGLAYEKFSSPLPPIIGPGSKNQYSTVNEFYCESCGVMYRFPPPACGGGGYQVH